MAESPLPTASPSDSPPILLRPSRHGTAPGRADFFCSPTPFCAKVGAEGEATKPFLQLNLRDESAKPAAANLVKAESEEPKPLIVGKRLNRLARKAAHRAARPSGRHRVRPQLRPLLQVTRAPCIHVHYWVKVRTSWAAPRPRRMGPTVWVQGQSALLVTFARGYLVSGYQNLASPWVR